MKPTRKSHYVPQWYQKRFLDKHANRLHYLDLQPDKKHLPDGRTITMNAQSRRYPSQCFYQTDLYTTFFGPYISDGIERRLFGAIDNSGAKAVRAYCSDDLARWHRHFLDFYSYIDSQKTRTPKGLDWVRIHFPELDQNELMREMQAISNMHCTIWTEGVREIVSAENSETKFILTDHPVTTYNPAFPPHSKECAYPNDPSIAFKGTRTIFPLSKDFCLVLSNYEYVLDLDNANPIDKRTNARFGRNTMVRTDALIKSRSLNEQDVQMVNCVLKSRARRYIAAAHRDWLHPDEGFVREWDAVDSVLLPPESELYRFGGELYAGFNDGTTYYQDAFGRTSPANEHLEKTTDKRKIGRNDPCGCGSGRKFKHCCRNKSEFQRPSWTHLSIRERNLSLYNGVFDILGFNEKETWEDVQREINPDHVKEIYGLYGFLWPPDTDIFSLLPKPDGECRALYTGLIDPRTVPLFALGCASWFDQVLIQHPFVNPASVKADFSPVHSSHLYLHQTLKDLYLLLTLMPYIDAGFVNFFPDPCAFDDNLRRQMMAMAKARSDAANFDTTPDDTFLSLAEDDHRRSILTAPRELRRAWIMQASQDNSDTLENMDEAMIEAVLDRMEEQSEHDPLAPLQNDVAHAYKGQLTLMHMAPNLEMSFVLSQATGSMLITDQPHRWKEMAQFSVPPRAQEPASWGRLEELISSQSYVFDANPQTNYRNRALGDYFSFRNSLRSILQATSNAAETPNHTAINELAKSFLSSYESTHHPQNIPASIRIEASVDCCIPDGGFVNKNAHRLLLTSGVQTRLDRVPLALLFAKA